MSTKGKAVRKVSGLVTLGPVKFDKGDAIYKFIRVGDAFLKDVRVPGVLSSLLKEGDSVSLWVAVFKVPTLFLVKAERLFVFAAQVGGVTHNAIDEVARGWTTAKWLAVFIFIFIGSVTLLLYIGLLFFIAAIRLSFTELPLREMRKELA